MKKNTEWRNIPSYDPNDKVTWKKVKREINGNEVDVIFRKGNPGMTVEEANEKRARGEQVNNFSISPHMRPRTYVATDVAPHILCEQDVAVKMRDGITIYADIYRPANTTEPLPLIISWAPFGKRPAEGQDGWKMMGVPPGTVSTMAKFEASDPGFWCRHGYAVANVDPRGVGHSEGDVVLWGEEDGKDGYDFIEWAAAQAWCNGRVTMMGNSGVCMVIWRIAAEQPPHLTCIAAWEGTGDMYRESMTYNGIPRPCFESRIVSSCACSNYVEDLCAMLIEHPYYDDYWKTKTPKWEKIRIPAYVAAGMCHFHLRGSLEGFRKIRSPKKWLRMHREMEWPDTYTPENMFDLLRFYDRYLKDERNGWEFTPKVRVDVMDAYGFDWIHNKEEANFPVPRTEYRKLYLDARNNSLNEAPVAEVSEIEYDNATGHAYFGIHFNEDTEIIGYLKLHLWIECRGYDNMDMFIWVKKYSADGQYLPIHCMKDDYRGTWGEARGCRRELDEKLTTDFQPVQAHQKDEPMEQGKIYPIDIELMPHARYWHKGEELRVEIDPEFVKTQWHQDPGFDFITDNGEPGKATHVIHTGGEYDSYLQIPVVPPKYRSGDYIYKY